MSLSHKHAEKLINELFQLERSGRYEEAISKLEDIWEDKAKNPKVDKFELQLSAEILLRCGSLIGFLGHNQQIPNSQELCLDIDWTLKTRNATKDFNRKKLIILELE